MSALGRVQNPDGSFEPFEQRKVQRLIAEACAVAGEADDEARVLAEQVAAAVAIFLANSFPERDITPDQIEDMVENVLTSLGKMQVVRVVLQQRERRRRRGRVLAPLAAAPMVERESADERVPWDAERIVATLLADTEVPLGVARHVARGVQERVARLAAERVSTGLIREFVNAELAALGYRAPLASQRVLGLSRADLDRLLFDAPAPVDGAAGPTAGGADDEGAGPALALLAPAAFTPRPVAARDQVAERVLRAYAAEALFAPAIVQAHRDGALHLSDLGRPLCWHEAAVSLEDVRRAGFAPPGAGLPAEPPADWPAFVEAARRCHRHLRPYVAGALAYHHLSLAWAPFAAGRTERDLDDALRAWLAPWVLEPEPFGQVVFDLPLVVPEWLRGVGALLPDGREQPWGRLGPELLRVIAALLRVLATLPAAPGTVPILELRLPPDAPDHPDLAPLVEQAAALAAAPAGAALRFRFDRTSAAPARGAVPHLFEGPSLAGWHRATPLAVWLNVARLAWGCRDHDRERLSEALGRWFDLVRQAAFQKRQTLKRAYCEGPDDEETRVLRRFLPLDSAPGQLRLSGLAEAALLLAREGDARDRCVRTMHVVLGEWQFHAGQGDPRLCPVLGAGADERVDRRFARLDRERHPELARRLGDAAGRGYQPGVRLHEAFGFGPDAAWPQEARLAALLAAPEPCVVEPPGERWSAAEVLRTLRLAAQQTAAPGLVFAQHCRCCAACGRRDFSGARCPQCGALAARTWSNVPGRTAGATEAPDAAGGRTVALFGEFAVDVQG